MVKKIKICVLQFKREQNYVKSVLKVKEMLMKVKDPDFALIGGEFALKESVNVNPYPLMQELAVSTNCNIIAPINANRIRFPNLKKGEKGFSSTHIFNREGEIVAIQDKQHFYWKERSWFRKGEKIKVFEVDGIKFGMLRGLDLTYPDFTRKMKQAEILSVSTMAPDDLMFDLAQVRATENQCYLIMSSFIGEYVGMQFVGNATIIKPNIRIEKAMRWIGQPIVLKRIKEEGVIEANLDIDYIREIRKVYPIDEF